MVTRHLITHALDAIHARLRAERGRFETLPNTGPEAQEVLDRFWEPDNRTPRREPLIGPDATETRLRVRLAPGSTAPLVLHLATHGFFLGQRAGEAPTRGPERALTLAGLALAGANRGLAGQRDAGGEDGILYALEAPDLNLEGTELVALSACNTGQGRVDAARYPARMDRQERSGPRRPALLGALCADRAGVRAWRRIAPRASAQ